MLEWSHFLVKQPKKMCEAYFPVSRITCGMFPPNIRSQIHMMLVRNFAYHYALQSLKASVKKTANGEAVSHRVCLPTDPYADLNKDLQDLGIIQHSRVTSVLTDLYSPKKDNTLLEYGREVFGSTGVTHYINPVIFKGLKKKMPTLCQRKCRLMPTLLYLEAVNAPANEEVRKMVSNGLKKVAVVHEKKWWKWFLGMFNKVDHYDLTVLEKPVDIFALFPSALQFAAITMAGTAEVGSMLYSMTLCAEFQKV